MTSNCSAFIAIFVLVEKLDFTASGSISTIFIPKQEGWSFHVFLYVRHMTEKE